MRERDAGLFDPHQETQEEAPEMRPTPLVLSGQQRALYDALMEKDRRLANMYLGTLVVLSSNGNPDQLALAAHGLRELMEKAARSLNVPTEAHQEKLKDKVVNLENRWTRTLQNTKCHHDQNWVGIIDTPLCNLLQEVGGFFQWFGEHHPRRREETRAFQRRLDGSGLDLPPDLEKKNIDYWMDALGYFVGVAHHSRETGREEFDRRTDEMECFLIDRMRPQTFRDMEAIDDIIREAEDYVDKTEAVKKAMSLIAKRGANYEYFFERLASPDWIEPLFREGRFQRLPLPVPKGDLVWFPPWPESRYLARMAKLAPEQVLEIILQIPETENARVHEDLADAALAMPAEMAARWAEKEATWVQSQGYLYSRLPEKLGALFAHLAEGEQVHAAVHLARALLALLPEPQVTGEAEEEKAYQLRPKPRTRFDTWEYGEILKRNVPDLVRSAGEDALRLLCDLLSDAVGLSQQGRETGRDYSYMWRPAIEDHTQNHPGGVQGLLVSAVRDAAETLMGGEGRDVLRIVEGYPFKVFQRIGLHLRRKWPEADPEGTARLVASREVFDDAHMWHEMFLLLCKHFDRLPRQAQQAYLEMAMSGGDAEGWLDHREEKTGHRPSQEDAQRYARHWRYGKLQPVRAFLEGELQEQFDALSQEFGEPEHPDFHVWMSEVWVGPASPKDVEELRSMSIGDLVSFLRDWQPSGEWRSPTPDGLGDALSALVASEPRRFASHAKRFQGLDPTYVRSFLSGLRDNKEKTAFPWPPVLGLCRWVLDQPREIPGRTVDPADQDADWISARKTIADLLDTGFKKEAAAEIPFDLRKDAWDVLKLLCEDPEPTPEHEGDYGGTNMGPATLAINTVRGSAIHAVVRYALWVRRHTEKAAGEEVGPARGFGEMSEVRDVLGLHLRPEYDPSPAIRTVYGQWFPWLVQLDAQWATENVGRIFPDDEALCYLHDAAWHTYVIFCAPYDDVFDILRQEYWRAVDRLGTAPTEGEYSKRLTEHLMTLYWRGKLDLDDTEGLLARFYAETSLPLRSHAIAFVGISLAGTEGSVGKQPLERLQRLLDQRIAAVRESRQVASDSVELTGFGWWFASRKFDDAWAVSRVEEVLKLTGGVDPDYKALEHIAELSSAMPAPAIRCLRLIVEGDKEGRHGRTWQQHARVILETGIRSSDTRVRQAAIDLIHRLGARGNLELRDLLPGKSL